MAQIPSSLPISYSQITGEFGGASLRAAADTAGLPAGAVSFSSFAGKSLNEGSGSFTAAFLAGTGVGYEVFKFGTGDCVFPNGKSVWSIYMGESSPGVYTEIVVKAQDAVNNDSVFKTIEIGGYTLNRTAGYWNPNFGGTWTWSNTPQSLILVGETYTPIFRTT